ncbi:hypothetical protein ACF1AX_31040 [Streptomyces sp. NPDC014802]|uniref:hypothetical protein n=1 Tax=Streptomyces sp. NPDC014802 TaxID=3364917 RepID=UPI003702D44D
MTNGTAPSQSRPPGHKMTIRVYQVDRAGTITQDRGKVSVIPYGADQLPVSVGFPPCACPRCRAGQAVTR